MRKIIALVVFSLLGASMAYAHPPSDIQVSFDSTSKTLQAVILHSVNNPGNHYINKVDVGLNGKEIIEQTISKQDNNTSQTVRYYIPDAKEGDVLFVEGYCNVSGTLKKEMTVTKKQAREGRKEDGKKTEAR